jgi:hypothetical protein
MLLELRCPSCACHFRAPPETPYADVLDRMSDEGHWFGLAGGDTFEDMIVAALARRGTIRCPECLDGVVVGEQSLVQAAMGCAPCC